MVSQSDPVTRQPIKNQLQKIQEAGKLCENLEKMEGDIVSCQMAIPS